MEVELLKISNFFLETFGWETKSIEFVTEEEKKLVVFGVSVNKRKFISLPHFSYSIINNRICSELEEDILLPISCKENINWQVRSFQKLSLNYDDSKVVSYLKLLSNEQEQLRSFSTSIRNNLKKGFRFSSNIDVGDYDLLDNFYYVYSRNMHRLGSPPYSKQFFYNLLYYYQNCKIIVVYIDKKPVACSFIVNFRDFSEMCWASSLSKYNKYNINYVLYWESIRYAINNNKYIFSFGRSTLNSPSYKFKHHWKPIEKTLFNNLSTKKAIDIKSLKLLNEVWKLLPYRLTILLGPKLNKYIY